MDAPMTESKEHLVRLFKALGDTNRLDIVLSIGKGARSVTEIIKTTGLSQTLASFHLRALREANIVTTERNGPFILYSLSDPNLDKTLIRLAKIINPNVRKGRETTEPSIQEAGKATRR
jgi:DNA-binding transcriptional ArsR family regulator